MNASTSWVLAKRDRIVLRHAIALDKWRELPVAAQDAHEVEVDVYRVRPSAGFVDRL
jgi:hypothetical protein